MSMEFSEKEILGDALATAKFSTDNYNTFSKVYCQVIY